jgi:hypothetical protein
MTSSNDLLAYQRMLQDKITTLQFLGSEISSTKKVSIEMTLDTGTKVFIEQRIVPFNLQLEIRSLIDDSIDHYQRQLTNSLNGSYEIFK